MELRVGLEPTSAGHYGLAPRLMGSVCNRPPITSPAKHLTLTGPFLSRVPAHAAAVYRSARKRLCQLSLQPSRLFSPDQRDDGAFTESGSGCWS
jgi:hypothetical protein